MAFTRENYRMVREKLMEITYWDKDAHPGERPPQKRDVVEAAKSVAMLDLALLKAEIEPACKRSRSRSLLRTSATIRRPMVPRQRAAVPRRAERPVRHHRQLAAHRRAHGAAEENTGIFTVLVFPPLR